MFEKKRHSAGSLHHFYHHLPYHLRRAGTKKEKNKQKKQRWKQASVLLLLLYARVVPWESWQNFPRHCLVILVYWLDCQKLEESICVAKKNPKYFQSPPKNLIKLFSLTFIYVCVKFFLKQFSWFFTSKIDFESTILELFVKLSFIDRIL